MPLSQSLRAFVRLAVTILFVNSMSFAGTKSIVIALPGPIENLDWNAGNSSYEQFVAKFWMRGLYRFDESNVLRRDLALSEERRGGKLHFKLQPNIQWSDGRPLLAQHFLDALKRILRKPIGSIYANYLFAIPGALEFFHSGKSRNLGIHAEGASELVIESAEALDLWKKKFTLPAFYPVRADVLEKMGNASFYPGGMPNLKEWRLHSYTAGQSVVFKSFDKIPNNTRTVEIQLGRGFDFCGEQNIEKCPDVMFLREEQSLGNKWELESIPIHKTYYLNINQNRILFARPTERSLFRTSISENWNVQGLRKARTLVPSDLGSSENVFSMNSNPKESGKYFPTNEGILVCGKDSKSLAIAREVQRVAKEKHGIKLRVDSIESSAMRLVQESMEYDLALMSWTADYLDAENYLSRFTSPNILGFTDSDFESWLSRLRRELSPKQRKELQINAERRLISERIQIVPLAYDRLWIASKRGLPKMHWNTLGELSLIAW